MSKVYYSYPQWFIDIFKAFKVKDDDIRNIEIELMEQTEQFKCWENCYN